MATLYGWYSELQAKNTGYLEYLNISGERVIVTEVTTTPEYTGAWDDMKARGEVISYVASYNSTNISANLKYEVTNRQFVNLTDGKVDLSEVDLNKLLRDSLKI